MNCGAGWPRTEMFWLDFNEPTMLTDSAAPVIIDGEIPQSFSLTIAAFNFREIG